MSKFKKGDIVGRISYNKDVIFEITNIIKTSNSEIYILKGITERIEADSPPEDLELMDKRIVNKRMKLIEDKILNRIEKCIRDESYNIKKRNNLFNFSDVGKRSSRMVYTGKILHLDAVSDIVENK